MADEARIPEVDERLAPTMASDLPDFMQAELGNRTGLEHLTEKDIKLPRLTLAQKMSHEVDPDHPKYMDGLRVGDIFNNLTGQVYDQPVTFTIVRADPPYWIEFYPRAEGGGVKDMSVPAGDARTKFTKDGNGRSVAPIATMFYNFILMLLPSKEVIAFSLKSTGIPAAKELNGLMMMRNAPPYFGKYKLASGLGKNAKGEFKVFQVRNAGNNDDRASFLLAKETFTNLQGRVIDIDPTVDSGGDIDDSMAANPEAPSM